MLGVKRHITTIRKSTMNKKRSLLSLLLLLVFLGGFVVWQQRPRPTTLSLNLTGTTGLKVAGTVVVDGVAREFSGTLPTKITVVARVFDYTIRMQEPNGELRGELKAGDDVYGDSSIARDFGGVRGGYKHSWRGKSGGVMTMGVKEVRP
jgi:hypothetical protein